MAEPGVGESAGAQSAPAQTDAWRQLRTALQLSPTRGHLVVGLLLFALGFAVAVQVQTTQEDALASARTSDLVRILDDLSAQRERLSAEALALERDLEALESGVDNAEVARKAARERLETLGILAGTLPVEGPGVEITITDVTGGVAAADLLDTVQELRDAGAEALSINDVRVVASTSFVDTAEGIAVDGETLASPYQITAIGNASTMATAMAIPGGVTEQITEAGGRVGVVETPTVTIEAVRPLSYPEYAQEE